MGVKRSRNFTQFPNRSKRRISQFEDCLADAMDTAMKSGAKSGVERIETSGTKKSGKAGRINKGDMRDAFEGALVSKNSKQITGQLGWLLETPFYSKYQDLGFDHVSGVHVAGMFALRDSSEEAWDEFNRLADGCVRKVFGL